MSAPEPLHLVGRQVSKRINQLYPSIPSTFLHTSTHNCSNDYERTPSLTSFFFPFSATIAKNIYVRAPETEVHYWAVFLRDLTVHELIKRVVQKYGFSDDERLRVKTAVRVLERNNGATGGGAVRLLKDDDVRGMEGEVPIDVKVSSLDDESEDWQLELRY